MPRGAGKEAPPYPDRLITLDSIYKAPTQLIQKRLRNPGLTQRGAKSEEPLNIDGIYGQDTLAAVQLFQARHADVQGGPLEIDGKVGSDPCDALFGAKTVPMSNNPGPKQPATR